jgi:hypothetical protein
MTNVLCSCLKIDWSGIDERRGVCIKGDSISSSASSSGAGEVMQDDIIA